jgi:hypothetical protein
LIVLYFVVDTSSSSSEIANGTLTVPTTALAQDFCSKWILIFFFALTWDGVYRDYMEIENTSESE